MGLFGNSNKVKAGSFKSVTLFYGNRSEEVIERFLGNGWKVVSTIPPDYPNGQKKMYITFEAGVDAKPVDIDFYA